MNRPTKTLTLVVLLSALCPFVASARPPRERRVPAFLLEGPKTAWTRCAALALAPSAAGGECSGEEGRTTCGEVTVQWHGTSGTVFVGAERVGDARQTAEVSAVVLGARCEIRLVDQVVYVQRE